MVVVDARGLSCPLPLMRAKRAVEEGAETLTVLVDSGTAKANVVNMLSDEGYTLSVGEDADGFSIEAAKR